MACDTQTLPGQTFQQRKEEVREQIARLTKLLAAGQAKAIVSKALPAQSRFAAGGSVARRRGSRSPAPTGWCWLEGPHKLSWPSPRLKHWPAAP